MGRVLTKAEMQQRWDDLAEWLAVEQASADGAYESVSEDANRAEGYYDGFRTAIRYVRGRVEGRQP
jgi:hypothetical protein